MSEGPQLHIHLDPVGGVAGDMFIAAVLDAFPDLAGGMVASIRAAGLPPALDIHLATRRDHALTGRRFSIDEPGETPAGAYHRHRTFRDLRQALQTSALPGAVCSGAVAMFTLLAEAEGRVHGTAVDDVSFHELGAWDSIADIVGAAHLIDALQASWSVGPLPRGGGRVATAHGPLPAPAPATALLLEGFDCFDDGVGGERVTPTGAVILRYLGADQSQDARPRRLRCSGTGFGTRTLPGLSNVLRLLAFEESATAAARRDRIAEILFEVDDQTAEDLAIGLDHLRAHPAVRDVLQVPAFGKKGRVTAQVRVLADPLQIGSVCDACLRETSTIGLRYQVLERLICQRSERSLEVEGRRIGLKAALRENGVTVKAEADDLADTPGGYGARRALRRRVEGEFE
jgi:uncharacterized protein (TIGR00299 family) protein